MRHFPRLRPMHLALAGMLLLGGCWGKEETGPVVVSVAGKAMDFGNPLAQMPRPAAKVMMAATAQGLVAFDAVGEIEPALAERWIVEDAGKSYIFRLRDASWPDGDRITAEEVARILTERVRANRRGPLKADLDAVDEILAMTGAVIEIRLTAPRPNFLQLLAQPQMGISGRNGGAGPYRREQREKSWMLTPAQDGAEAADGQPRPRNTNRVLRAERMALGIVRFIRGDADLVLGGRYSDLPLLRFADVENRAIRMDPVRGLFGLAVTEEKGFLADAANREALSMAIERERLPVIFSLAGWATTNSVLPDPVDLGHPPALPRWAGLSIEERRVLARAAVDRWKRANGRVEPLRIALPPGPGSNLLFGIVSSDFARIGVPTVRVDAEDDADLRLIDEVAPYDSALWFLGRLSCTAGVSCSPEAEARLSEAQQAQSLDIMLRKLSEADVLTLAHGGYIPLAVPLRWSLVSRRLRGFQPSPRALHPLNHLLAEPR